MNLPEAGDLFPTEHAELLVNHIVDNFDELREEYANNGRKVLNNKDLKHFRFDLIPTLMNRYIIEGIMTQKHEMGITEQICSPDPENWLVALMMLKQFKKK